MPSNNYYTSENSLVLDILQDLQNEKIKTPEEIDMELKQKIYEVFQPFLNFPQNKDNFAEVYQRLKGYEYVKPNEIEEGDYVRYLNPKYFYDIQLMKGGFVSDITKKKRQITLVNGNRVIKIFYPKLTLFRKLDSGDIIKQKIIASLLED
tara:strand:+ start:401 stop:850 length:450 start_codon:yes stop_codon:yes gene_type:complete